MQRLVWRLCGAFGSSRAPTAREQRWLVGLGLEAESVPHAVGCTSCHSSGYRGRSVIAEVHVVDDQFRDLVTSGSAVSVLRGHVAASGVPSLAARAAGMMLGGTTTPEEIKRVVGWQ